MTTQIEYKNRLSIIIIMILPAQCLFIPWASKTSISPLSSLPVLYQYTINIASSLLNNFKSLCTKPWQSFIIQRCLFKPELKEEKNMMFVVLAGLSNLPILSKYSWWSVVYMFCHECLITITLNQLINKTTRVSSIYDITMILTRRR